MFHVHYLETEFLQTVWKLKNKLSWNDYRVVSLYLSSMHIHELLEPDSKLSLFTFYLHILSRLRRSTSILKFTSRAAVTFTRTGLLFMQPFSRIIHALEKYGGEPLVAFTYLHGVPRLRAF